MLARTDLRGIPGDLRADLARPAAAGDDIGAPVAEIIAEVRRDGDAALRRLTARFDGCDIDDLRVSPSECAAALDGLEPSLRAALELARDQIAAWHEAQREKEASREMLGVHVHEVVTP